MANIESTSRVAPCSAHAHSKTPFRGVFSLVGSRALVCRLENPGSHPSKMLHQNGVFSLGDYIARTPHDSKSLTGLRGMKRYAVCREARVQFPNNPQDWLKDQRPGTCESKHDLPRKRGEHSLSCSLVWVGEAFRRTMTNYLYRVSKKPPEKVAAHLWDGADTYCRMWSTGGLKKSRNYKVSGNPDGHRICHMCEVKSGRL